MLYVLFSCHIADEFDPTAFMRGRLDTSAYSLRAKLGEGW